MKALLSAVFLLKANATPIMFNNLFKKRPDNVFQVVLKEGYYRKSLFFYENSLKRVGARGEKREGMKKMKVLHDPRRVLFCPSRKCLKPAVSLVNLDTKTSE